MCPGADLLRRLTLVALLLAPALVRAQDEEPEPPGATDPLEVFLDRRGLDELLSTYLLDEIRTARGNERGPIAERLGRHYARELAAADSPERRRELQERSRSLLELVPDSDSFELRITIHKASFLIAEDVASRFPLRLTDEAEQSEALITLRATANAFADIGRRIDSRVDALENMESRATEGDMGHLRDQLAEARRLRSLAMYYAGWSQYYSALMSGETRLADAALRSFGWLLNAPGNREPVLDNLPVTLLRYEHVARSAMACAMAHSLTGDDVTASQWLDAIEQSDETPPSLSAELTGRRIEVLGRARRWADLQRLIDRRRLGSDPVRASALPVGEARLIAVYTLDALAEGSAGPPGRARLLEAMAQVAMGDLVALGEIGHVLDLVRRFGTTPMGDSGFVVLYVRGLRAYERARDAHAADGGGDEPTENVSVINRYLDAVRALDVAEATSDAQQFPGELVQARMMRGLALYYANKLAESASVFESVFSASMSAELREESLWYAIVSLDRAVEGGRPSLRDERDRLATVYLQSFPSTDRAAKLLLRRVEDGLLTDDQAIAVLLEVPQESPLYGAARRHASRLLYRKYRSARGSSRDYAAATFVEIAEELINMDVERVRTGSPEEVREAGPFVVLRVRQALDALLTVSVPDVQRAARLLDLVDDVGIAAGIDLSDVESELAYRRLQIALESNDQATIDLAVADLQRTGGVHARSADRLLYSRAVERWRGAPSNAEEAVRVVAFGSRVLDQFRPLENKGGDATLVGVLDTVAEAATAAWRLGDDDAMRDIAIENDRLLLELGMQSASSLRRLGAASEDAGDLETSLDAWNTLLAGLREASSGWFEARVESIRVLAQLDRLRARQVLDQHVILYPEFGPDPWGDQLRALNQALAGSGPTPTEGGGG